MIHKDAKIYIAGHRGLVGSALSRKFQAKGYHHLLLKTSAELDLRHQQQVFDFFEAERPEYVLLAAAKVGGIQANNTYRAEFLYDNLAIETHVIHAAFQTGVKKLLFLGSSCIYPRLAPQPLREEALLTGPLEPTNEPYAIAKIAGIKLCEAYRAQYGCDFTAVMPTNLYGPGDNFDLKTSHVLPALLRKCHEAKLNQQPTVELWGTGTPRREFLHVDDLADACFFLMQQGSTPSLLNIGTGTDLTIQELATQIAQVVGYRGTFRFDPSQPDGTPQKLLDVSRLHALGWQAQISLAEGLQKTYAWYCTQPEPLALR